MSVSLDIIPSSESVNMYGAPDTSTAYSLSGHITISLKSSFSLFERHSTARLLLQSLNLTFEGQTEIATPKLGYSAIRLCSISRELVSGEPLEMNNEGDEDSAEPCVWNIVFNFTIPGWLPETTAVNSDEFGVKYALHATAKFTVLNDNHPGSAWRIVTLCSPFRSRVRSVCAKKQILLRRFIAPLSNGPIIFHNLHYLIKTPQSAPQPRKTGIPAEILEKIKVIATLPESANMEDEEISVTLRMRTEGLDDTQCRRLQVKEISSNIIQNEKYRLHASGTYLKTYPLPPNSQQPPNEPLIAPHPISVIYECGFAASSESPADVATRTTSLLPRDETGRSILTGNNYAFAEDAVPCENPNWYTVEITIPFESGKIAGSDIDRDWMDAAELRPSMSTPLFSVSHEVSLSVTCSYDMPGTDAKQVTERLSFKIPIDLVRVLVPPVPAHGNMIPPSMLATSSHLQIMPTLPAIPPCILPAYSQLYDRDGERKIDYSIPLPLYEPQDALPSTSTSFLDLSDEGSQVSKSTL
ncbi:hypothetical protein AX17_002909 [Amanita inopinata Kibby_2008]|nr:hypothetical protein AX17_002909 [Amanita inopinata Kibby_2008]